MINKNTILFLLTALCFSSCLSLSAQELTEFSAIKLEKQYSDIEVDPAGNIYLISPLQELVRLNDSSKVLGNFRDRYLGNCKFLNIDNPLRLMIFYPDRSVILELDNMLGPKRKLELESLDLSENSLVCRTYDNNFWLYDERRFRLVKFDSDLEITLEGEWMRNVVTEKFEPFEMKEYKEKTYLFDSSGVYVFDLFGSFIKRMSFEGIQHVDFYNGKMYFLKEGSIFSYNLKLGIKKETKLLTAKGAKSFSIANDKLYLLEQKRIRTFSL